MGAWKIYLKLEHFSSPMPSPVAVMCNLNIEEPHRNPVTHYDPPKNQMARIPAQTLSKSEDGLTRAQDLWFQDCGLRSDYPGIFRVSGTILAVQSTVFRDMLSTPAATDTIDGCPFVLLPDTAEDTGNFLVRCSATGM
jgi:hypothetical protein